MTGTSTILHYSKYSAGTLQPCQNLVIVESAVKLMLNDEQLLTFICTPTELNFLAAGYLYNVGCINSKDEIDSIAVDASTSLITVKTNHRCKAQSLSNTGNQTSFHNSETVPAAVPIDLMEAFYVEQNRISQSSGLHSSAFASSTSIDLICEDIGRHNTLDKLTGKVVLEEPDYTPFVLLTTGRISSDMVQKAKRIGISIVTSRTTPTNAAVACADTLGITIIGYTRSTSYNIYTHEERIRL